MNRLPVAAYFLSAVLGGWPALAAEEKSPTPAPQTACRDPRYAPDYVPGLAADGAPVAPADVPETLDAEISTEVFVGTRSRSRQRQGVGVDVRLKGLESLPLCQPPPPPQKSRR